MSKPKAKPPTVYVIAGPNGAGKTTFASEFLPDFVKCREFLNADLIASEEHKQLTVKQKQQFGRIERQAKEAHEKDN